MRRRYEVVATREDGSWLADVPAVPGAHTDARNLLTLDRYVREVIVLAEDLPDDAEGSFELAWTYSSGDPVLDAELGQLRARRAELDTARHALEAATAQAAADLARRGFSVRDTAALLGLSSARAGQLQPGRSAAPGGAPARELLRPTAVRASRAGRAAAPRAASSAGRGAARPVGAQ